MVKGVAKQVILVRPQGDEVFEQAIFIVRDGAKNVTERELLLQARDTMEEKKEPKWQGFAAFSLGGGLVGLIWLLCSIL